MSIFKKLKEVFDNSVDIEINKRRTIRQEYRDFDGSTSSNLRSPISSIYGEGSRLVAKSVYTNYWTENYIYEIASMESTMRNNGNSKYRLIEDLTSSISLDTYFELCHIDIDYLKEMIRKVTKEDRQHLMSNFTNCFPDMSNQFPDLKRIYVLCVVIDIIGGVLPDIYFKKKGMVVEVYSKEEARKILNAFPIRAREDANTIRIRSANLIIAAQCAALALRHGDKVYHIIKKLKQLTQYQNFEDMTIEQAAKVCRIKLSSIDGYSMKEYEAKNKEICRFFGMVRFLGFWDGLPVQSTEGSLIYNILIHKGSMEYKIKNSRFEIHTVGECFYPRSEVNPDSINTKREVRGHHRRRGF